MLKEIHEQTSVIAAIMQGRLDNLSLLDNVFREHNQSLFKQLDQIQIIACGTSYHAGLVAKHWIEKYTGIQCLVEIASEYRYRDAAVRPNTLAITISQSGETADTVDALRRAKKQNYLATLAICNVKNTTLEKESDFVLHTEAGVEIGIASTKVFLTQLIALLLVTMQIAKQKNTLTAEKLQAFSQALQQLPELVAQTLAQTDEIQQAAQLLVGRSNTVFMGRNQLYPIAMEGALKLKETSYIQAEAYPAGEFRHGPIALVADSFPVIALVAKNELTERMQANIAEILQRNGRAIVFAEHGVEFDPNANLTIIRLPKVAEVVEPMVYAVPLQLFAYYVALARGTNVDQPRNLTKSVAE